MSTSDPTPPLARDVPPVPRRRSVLPGPIRRPGRSRRAAVLRACGARAAVTPGRARRAPRRPTGPAAALAVVEP